MTEYTFDENTVSDLHKDAYGFRPCQAWWSAWKSSTNDEKQKVWDYLCSALEATIELEEARKSECVNSFRALVAKIVESGAKDIETAHRWIMEASNCGGDWEHLCWSYGLPYSYFKA